MQDVNFIHAYFEKHSTLVLVVTAKEFSDFFSLKLRLRRERTKFGKSVAREDNFQQTIAPSGGRRLILLRQPFASLADVTLCCRLADDCIALHLGERGILCLAGIRSKTTRAGSPLPAFILSNPR